MIKKMLIIFLIFIFAVCLYSNEQMFKSINNYNSTLFKNLKSTDTDLFSLNLKLGKSLKGTGFFKRVSYTIYNTELKTNGVIDMFFLVFAIPLAFIGGLSILAGIPILAVGLANYFQPYSLNIPNNEIAFRALFISGGSLIGVGSLLFLPLIIWFSLL